jgi:putative heme transporter
LRRRLLRCRAMQDQAPLPPARSRSVRKVLIRAAITIVALVFSGLLIARVFDDFDWSEVLDAMGSLSGTEVISLAMTWVVFISAQGLMTSSLLPGLPVRRGVMAYLGPAAVSSAIPGPSDLPVRYKMFLSWGLDPREAQLAVGANGIFSIGAKLLLPVVAGVILALTPIPVSGAASALMTVSIVLGVVLVVIGVVFGSERRTAAAGRFLSPVWRAGLRLLRKEAGDQDLPERLVAVRNDALRTVRDRWWMATWAAFLVSSLKAVLLIMCLRFVGVDADVLRWVPIFVVFALVEGMSAVPIMPGNVGVAEVAYISMLTAIAGGENVNAIASGILLFRLLTWLILIPAGLGALALWRNNTRRAARQAPT